MSKKKSTPKTNTSASKGRRKAAPAKKAAIAGLRSNSKQASVLAMLSQTKGTTIAAIMKATGGSSTACEDSLPAWCERSLS